MALNSAPSDLPPSHNKRPTKIRHIEAHRRHSSQHSTLILLLHVLNTPVRCKEIFSIEHVSCDLRGCVATSDQSRLYLDLATRCQKRHPPHYSRYLPGASLRAGSYLCDISRLEKFMYKSSTWEKRAKLTNGRTSSGLIYLTSRTKLTQNLRALGSSDKFVTRPLLQGEADMANSGQLGPGNRNRRTPNSHGLRTLMLQTYNKSLSPKWGKAGSTHDVPYSAQPSLADLFAKVIGFIRRQFPIVLSVVPLTIGLAAVYLFTTPPLYSAQARIMIDTGKSTGFPAVDSR